MTFLIWIKTKKQIELELSNYNLFYFFLSTCLPMSNLQLHIYKNPNSYCYCTFSPFNFPKYSKSLTYKDDLLHHH